MSRTLSIDKIGPDPHIEGQALSLYQPACGDLGVSLRRSPSQFNIRPWRFLAGQSVATAGAASSIRQSVYAGGACGARRKRDRGSLQQPRIRPRDGIDGFRRQRACPSIRPCTPPPGTSTPAPVRWRRQPCPSAFRARACRGAFRPAGARLWQRASSRQGRAPGLWPSPSSAASSPGGAGPPPSSPFSGACYRPWRCRPGRLYRLGLIL